MTLRDIAGIGLKLLGVYAIIQALSHTEVIGLAISAAGSRHGAAVSPLQWAIMVLPLGLLLVSGLLLIFCSRRIGRVIVPDQETVPADAPLSYSDIQAIAFSVAGLAIACVALPRLGRILVNAGLLRGSSGHFTGGRARIRSLAQAAGPVVQLVIGVALFFGGRGLAKVWQKLQGQEVIPNQKLDGPESR